MEDNYTSYATNNMVQYTPKGIDVMRPLLDILVDEKRLSEELSAIDQAIRSTVILFDETYAIPGTDTVKDGMLERCRNELDVLRNKEKELNSILTEIRSEIREYFEELNK